MKILCENEARRLFLYHLAQSFFHERAENITLSASLSEQEAIVTIEDGRRFEGKAKIDCKKHSERKRAENAALGLAFGRAARFLTSYIPPYGTLIGVRPVKVPLFYLENGKKDEEILLVLQEEFLVSPEKALLLLELAKKELSFAETLESRDGMLYLSIPFCPTRCSYCSFVSSAAPKHLALIPDYLSQLLFELEQTAELLKKKEKRIRSVYVGGGTPGILTASQLNTLLSRTREHFGEGLWEFCVELGRPDTVTEEKMRVLEELGVDRVSINPQTTCDGTLERIGRRHTSRDFFSAMEMAKKFSFSVNCDLISSLPGETPQTFLKSVRETLAFSPENLTIHALCQKKSATDQAILSEGDFLAAVTDAHKLCINKGLEPYYLYRQKKSASDLENLGFAKKGYFSPYNLAMMEDLCDIFACGAGGIGKRIPKEKGGKIIRFPHFKYPTEYLLHPERIGERLKEIEAML